MAAGKVGIDYTIDDSDPHHLFDSPKSNPKRPSGRNIDSSSVGRSDGENQRVAAPNYSVDDARDAALRQELENVRRINQVLEGVVESLEKAKGNMETVSRTVGSASTLLETWTRILSQAEHNQRLILNPAWQGASQDLADIEIETAQRQLEAQRKKLDEQQRREAAARKAEEDERKRAEASTRGARGTRNRGRPVGRAGSGLGNMAPSSGYIGASVHAGRGSRASSASSARTGSGPGRGTRGRGRGLG